MRPYLDYRRLIRHNLEFWLARNQPLSCATLQPHVVPADFFGVNVDAGDNDDSHDGVVNALRDLGIRRVRVTYSYDTTKQRATARLSERLVAEGFQIFVHLVQPASEALRMNEAPVVRRWEQFVVSALSTLPADLCELGNQLNRFSSGGHSPLGLLEAVKIAAPVCRDHGVRWCGPNTSDFEPLFAAGLLGMMSRAGLSPWAQTVNLCVDRVGTPEAADIHVAGTTLAGPLHLDLVAKTGVLAQIGSFFGVERTISTRSHWTLCRRGLPRRRYVSAERYAELLVRYGTLAAASGRLERIYWGSLIHPRNGIIAGEPDSVAGRRPAFLAYRNLIREVAASRFIRLVSPGDDLRVAEWDGPGGPLTVCWSAGESRVQLTDVWPPGQEMAHCRTTDLYGRRVSTREAVIGSSPLFIRTSEPLAPAAPPTGAVRIGLSSTQASPPELEYLEFRQNNWCGFVHESFSDRLLELFGRGDTALPSTEVPIRSTRRSRLFLLDGDRLLPPAICKEFPSTLLDRRRLESRASRAWRSTLETLRRNIPAAPPLALVQDSRDPAGRNSYLLSRKVEGRTLREFLRSFEGGEGLLGLHTPEELIHELGRFVRQVHTSGIFHRDLTGGNILVRERGRESRAWSSFDFTLLDLDRARFRRRLGWLCRLRDLSRLKIAPRHRDAFLSAYSGDSIPLAHRLAVALGIAARLYRLKLATRRSVRRWLAGLAGVPS